MKALIEQSFAHVDNLYDHVADGCYDLIGPNSEVIMPEYYEDVIQPGMTIKMLLWPLPESDIISLPSLPASEADTTRSRARSRRHDRYDRYDETLSDILNPPPYRRSYRSRSRSRSSRRTESTADNDDDDASTIDGRIPGGNNLLSMSEILAPACPLPPPRRSKFPLRGPPPPRRATSPDWIIDHPPFRRADEYKAEIVDISDIIEDQREYDFVSEDEAGGCRLPGKKPWKGSARRRFD
jgi:hypothetical protein